MKITKAHDTENTDKAELVEVLRNTLSPEAIAGIAYIVHCVTTNDKAANKQIQWFADILAEMVGGWDAQEKMAEELNARIG